MLGTIAGGSAASIHYSHIACGMSDLGGALSQALVGCPQLLDRNPASGTRQSSLHVTVHSTQINGRALICSFAAIEIPLA